MPFYEYQCGEGHISERFAVYARRPKTVTCDRCGSRARPIISAPHVEPDGVHSYMPNLGDPARFERQQEAIRAKQTVIDRE